MSEKEKTMHEFYASYEIEIDEFIGGFDEDGFEYFYENVILKMGSKPDVEFDSYEVDIYDENEFEIEAIGNVYKLIHMFDRLEIILRFTMSSYYNDKPFNMNIGYSIYGLEYYIETNFYNYKDFEFSCNELLEKLRNLKLKALIEGF